ncbi:TPA: DUF551 domain-containing protein [Escherichia coli]|uniref:DUF551 domain-containing protein n=1 Tax=Escherichia coli TaxID=562 RepID=UPI000DDDE8EB|nr:DUF551 domain-containing protein [Escherichia coli]
MSNSARLQLGFSPLSKTIMLAKMRDVEGGRMRVGNDPGRDVTNEAAQLVWRLVMAEGGEMWSAMWNGNRWDDGTEYPDPHSVTHWREMPAAPQQEVK